MFAWWKNSSQSFDPWHEIARPQVHGHDVNCITIIRGKGNHRFVSGADEKVSRVFEAPLSFLKTLNQLISQACTFPENDQPETQILGANMSALGLSQKPIYVHGNFTFLLRKKHAHILWLNASVSMKTLEKWKLLIFGTVSYFSINFTQSFNFNTNFEKRQIDMRISNI